MRAIFLSSLVILALVRESIEQCVEGCLSCSVGNDKCLFCDTPKDWILRNGKCEKVMIQNCNMLSRFGSCDECDTGYYPQNGLCAQLQTLIENCAIYRSGTECRYCASGFYLKAGKCVETENLVENCLYYEEEGTCARCKPMSFLFIDQRYCVPITDSGNCFSWTQIQCSKCRSGYFLNQNLYISNIFKNETDNSRAVEFLQSVKLESMRYKTEVCQKGKIANCILFNGPEKCLKCETGFSLLENKCLNINIPTVVNCLEIDENSKCVKCVDNYFISPAGCKPVSVVSNCALYNNTATYSQCLQCSDEYYLSENFCLVKQKSLAIVNCKSSSATADACGVCNSGYEVTTDGLACLPVIENCKSYYPTSSTSTSLECEYCIDKMFFDLKQKKCVVGTIAYCQLYQQYADQCEVCMEGYYKSPMGVCVQHLFANKRVCAKWSQSVPNLCEECPTNHFRVYNLNSCNAITIAIDKCDVYETSSTCAKCMPSFLVSADKKSCVPSMVPFCVRESAADICEECGAIWDPTFSTRIPYVLSYDKRACNVPDMTSVNNCRTLDTSQPDPKCNGCKYPYYPAFLGFKRQFCLSKTNHKLKKAAVVAKITDCEVMDLDTSSCIKCINGKLVSAGACVSVCPNGQAIYRQEIIKDYVNNSIYISRRNYCAAPPFANCIRVETSVNTIGLNYGGAIFQGCIQCDTGYLGVVDLNSPNWGLGHIYISDLTKQSPTNRFTFINSCVLTATANSNLITATSPSLTNCKFLQKSGTFYGCVSCKFGYTGKVIWANNAYFIESCNEMTSCDSSKWFIGLGGMTGQLKTTGIQTLPLEFYVSCHICKDPTKVVAFERNMGYRRTITNAAQLAGLSIWDPTANPPYMAAATYDQTICIALNLAWNMPIKCAMLMFVPDMNNLGYVDQLPNSLSNIFCVACEPGYRATVDVNGWVLACTLVENCFETQFNGCKKCNNGFAFGYDPKTGLIDFGHCHDTTLSPNCLHGFVNVYKVFVCAICKEGFILNRDYLCDPVEINDCLSFSIFAEFPVSIPSISRREPLLSLIWYEPNSCRVCQSGQLVAEGLKSSYCIKDFFQASYGFTSSSYFVRNCADSFFDSLTSTIRCNECNPGSSLISQRCYSNANASQIVKLGNCTIYDSYTQKCAKCGDFSFLDAGICYDGFLPYCAEYETWNKCLRCQEGYIMIATKTENTICIAPSPGLNCTTFDRASSLKGELKCNNCTAGAYSTSVLDDKPAYTCLEASAVKNCVLHNITINYMNTALECLRCKDHFYLKYNYCFNRTIVENCDEYNPNENACARCKKGYLVASNGLSCEVKAITLISLPNCMELLDLNNCMRCIANFYLENNRCLEVPSDSRIKYCLYYNSNIKCEKCSAGFYIKDGQCFSAQAQNCLEYESEKRCLNCPANNGLRLENDLLNCVPLDIEKCSVYDTTKNYPFECLICDAEYYVNYETKRCTPIESKIEFCSQYRDATTCGRCQADMTISPDGNYCYASPDILKYVDDNCQESYLSNVPMCNACAAGYLFNKGACTPCKQNMAVSGCMYCDPDNLETCLVCASGFFMNNRGICIKIRIPPVKTSASIFSALALMLAAIWAALL